MRSIGNNRPSGMSDRPDWLEMERRLENIEDVLVNMQTIINLLLDLLERAIPLSDDERNMDDES